MKRTILTAVILCVVLLVSSVANAQSINNSDEAKNVLRHSREKCRSIDRGHYVVEHKKKYMSGKDTFFVRYTCDFVKKPADTLFGMFFSMVDEDDDWKGYSLYSGNELVGYDDTVGTIMSCDLWADEIMGISHNYNFFDAFIDNDCYPLPSEKLLTDSLYSFSISEAMLDGKFCYFADYRKTAPESAGFGMKCIRYEVELWIDKQNYLPLQYSIAYDIVEQKDTLYQYDLFKLIAFDTSINESRLTLQSIPANVTLKDYVPYEEPKPLATGEYAPDWSLPTLTGDTVRLADLKGNVVLIDFFYKKCAPCCAALPALQRLHEKYKDKGFVMIGIDPNDDPEKDNMADFLSKRDVTYTVLFSDRELPKTYHVSAYPTLFFLNRKGEIVKIQEGYSKALEDELEKQLLKML